MNAIRQKELTEEKATLMIELSDLLHGLTLISCNKCQHLLQYSLKILIRVRKNVAFVKKLHFLRAETIIINIKAIQANHDREEK